MSAVQNAGSIVGYSSPNSLSPTSALSVGEWLGRNIAEAVLASGDRLVATARGPRRLAPFEQLSSERFKAVVDTNFYGVVNATRAALPIMRKQKSGCILQISSLGGRLAVPDSAPYHAAKWAVGGFAESLAQEVAPFGVKVCALEPGGMRTNWGVRAHQDAPELLLDYEPSVGAIVKALHSLWGQENSDPGKVAQIILRLADSDHLPAHLLLAATRSSMLR